MISQKTGPIETDTLVSVNPVSMKTLGRKRMKVNNNFHFKIKLDV